MFKLSFGKQRSWKTGVEPVQSTNAIVDAVSATILKQHNPGLTDPQLRDSFCRHMIQQDTNKIALALRDGFFIDRKQAAMMFVCRRLNSIKKCGQGRKIAQK